MKRKTAPEANGEYVCLKHATIKTDNISKIEHAFTYLPA